MTRGFGRITSKKEPGFSWKKKRHWTKAVPAVANKATRAQWEVFKALLAEAIRQERSAPERSAYTIQEFCDRFGIKPRTYYTMRKNGQGPAEIRINRVVRISVQAVLDFILRHEVQPSI